MNTIGKTEITVIGILFIVFLMFLVPQLDYSRREARDEMKRNEIALLKKELEQYFNKKEKYPLEFETGSYSYIVVDNNRDGAKSWYLRAVLENDHKEKSDYDYEEGRNYRFRYVREGDLLFYDVCGGEMECLLSNR